MAATYFEIVAIASQIDHNRRRHFSTILHGPPGNIEIPTTLYALQDYATFQRDFLAVSGFMFLQEGCEDRDAVAANATWRQHISSILFRTHEAAVHAQQEQPPGDN